MSKVRIIYILLLFLLGTTASPAYAATDRFLDGLVDEALRNNPQLAALRSQWEAQKADIASEGNLPQPQAGFTYYGESVQTRVGPMEKKFSLSQRIPSPGKLSAQRKIAVKEARIASARYILAARGLIERVKTSFYDYYFIHESLKVIREEKDILEHIRSVIQRRYETLQASQQDLLKVDLEISRLEEKILRLQQEQNRLRGQLNKILSRPYTEEVAVPSQYNLTLQPLEEEKAVLVRKALAESPHILIEQLGLAKQDLRVTLARQEYIPDLGVMAEYIAIGEGETMSPSDGQDVWMLGFNVRVPLWFWKINADIRSEKSKRQAQAYKVKVVEDMLASTVDDLLFSLETQKELASLYQDVMLTQAQQNFEVSRRDYENGMLDFLDLLDTERIVISVRLSNIKQVVDHHKTIARFEYMLGEELP